MLLAVVVGVLFFDPTGWGAIALGVVSLCAVGLELSKLVGASWIVLIALSAVEVARNLNKHPAFTIVGLSIGAVALLVIAGRMGLTARPDGPSTSSKVILGVIAAFVLGAYSSGLLSLLLLKSTFPPLLSSAIPIWAGDTAAIFAGKAFGKHKLAPSISPNKTWEGSVANLLAAVGAAAALGYFLKYPMDKMLLLGVSCGVIGQLGDLFESYLKRQAGVKDSGNLLPGHGGVFDRLDSLLMTAPFSYWILSSFLK